MERLTPKEEQIMQTLWKLKKGFVKDIIELLPPPEPKYTTISSIVRILEEKGFIDHKAYGRTHEYFPKISKLAYKKFAFQRMLSDYFDGSYENVVSFMVKDHGLSTDELEELRQIIEEEGEE